ncbi:MAG TPA: hypothetical protein VL992_21040 [Tepidisphaeraceae bacterium]|nr:hypothetical protein [Tepidisphaeraceae bacterium]
MTALALPSPEIVVCSTNVKQTPARLPWWHGLTVDEQDEALDRIDPENYPPGQKPPLPIGRWNREKRRVHRLRMRWIQQIASLRLPCRCKTCRRHHRPPFPRYYVANSISYECWLEAHAIDDEIEEFLIPLRNDRERVGSVVIGRKPPKQRNIPN